MVYFSGLRYPLTCKILNQRWSKPGRS